MMTGFRVDPIFLSRGMSPDSNEATLYSATFIRSRKSTEVWSNGVENRRTPRRSACFLRPGCHSHGVCAQRYILYIDLLRHASFDFTWKYSFAQSIVIVSGVYVWSLIASTPASTAAS